jgi:hypothetical protein
LKIEHLERLKKVAHDEELTAQLRLALSGERCMGVWGTREILSGGLASLNAFVGAKPSPFLSYVPEALPPAVRMDCLRYLDLMGQALQALTLPPQQALQTLKVLTQEEKKKRGLIIRIFLCNTEKAYLNLLKLLGEMALIRQATTLTTFHLREHRWPQRLEEAGPVESDSYTGGALGYVVEPDQVKLTAQGVDFEAPSLILRSPGQR